MRIALVESLSLAAESQRTLLYAPFMNCPRGEVLEDALDLSSVSRVVKAAPIPSSLYLTCGDATFQKPPMYVSSQFLDQSRTKLTLESVMHHAVWENHNMTWVLEPTTPQLNSSTVRSHDDACVGLLYAFAATKPSGTDKLFAIEGSLLPASAVREEVARFLTRALDGDSSAPFVGIHLRNELQHVMSGSIADASGCRIPTASIINATSELLASTGARRVMLATDNPHGNCTRAVVEAFNPILVQSGIWPEDSCREAAFVQDVMGHCVGFVGSSHSTFSIAIDSIKTHRFGRFGNTRLFKNNGWK